MTKPKPKLIFSSVIGIYQNRLVSVLLIIETETDLPIIVFANFIDVSPIILATNNGRRTILPPFEPSRCDESNGGSFVLLSLLDAEIIGKTSMNQLFIDILPIISASSGGKRLKPPPFDSLH